MLLVAGIAVIAFLIGYVISAISFTAGDAPAAVVLVPDVRELQLDAATRAMVAAGLEPEVGDSFPNVEIPAGAVIAQTPLPGEEVSPGGAVRLIVSTGPPRTIVPEVEAMPLTLAIRALETSGFEVVVEQDTFPGELGTVVGVEPAPGTPLHLPATVRLQVGSGFEIIEMPTLIGMLEETAVQILEELGLQVAEVVYEDSEFGEPGGVVAQFPAPGDSVATGTSVELRVTTPDAEDDDDIRGRLGINVDRPGRG